MTDIDDNEALRAAEQAWETGSGLKGSCRVYFDIQADPVFAYNKDLERQIEKLESGAHASNLRQQLAEANAKLELADAYIATLKACADIDAGCMRSLRNDLDAVTAKLERLEKAARDVLWQQKHGTEGSQWGAFDRMSHVLLVPAALSPSPASPPQEPAAPVGPRFQVTAEEFTEFFAFWMKGSTKALLMDELNRILAQRPAQPVQEPASPPAGAGVVELTRAALFEKLGPGLSTTEKVDYVLGLLSALAPGSAIHPSSTCSLQLAYGWKDERDAANERAEKAERELAECREEVQAVRKTMAAHVESRVESALENSRGAALIAADALENRRKTIESLEAECARLQEELDKERDEHIETADEAAAAESALAVERETVERLRREVENLEPFEALHADMVEQSRGLRAHLSDLHKHASEMLTQWKCMAMGDCRAAVYLESALKRTEDAARIQAQPNAEPIAVEADPSAPRRVAELPAYWDERRKRQGKPDTSRCAAELRVALEASAEPAKPGEVERIERLERAMRVLCEGGYFYEGARFENALAVLNKPTSAAPSKG